MTYNIKQLAELSGVTTRTLRWYDKLNLLRPTRTPNGYRAYSAHDVDRLQLILFYRELDMPLAEIADLLAADSRNKTETLARHLKAMERKQERLNGIIAAMKQAIAAKEKGTKVNDVDKFEAFKADALHKNEEHYGSEIRKKYGTKAVDESNAKFAALTQEQYQQMQDVTEQLNAALKTALEGGDPSSAEARRAAELHKQWLCFYWPDYSAEKHKGITQMYVDDPRFTAYYDKIALGAAQFLRDAVWAWLG